MLAKNTRSFVAVLCLTIPLCGLAVRGVTADAPAPAAPAPAVVPLREARKLCDLQDKRIDESSGLAMSRKYPDLIWTHNDSGDTARAFLIDATGKTRAVVNLAGASAFDWEDMAVAGEGPTAWVYTGDIGDNFKVRSTVTIYRFREPDLASALAQQPAEDKMKGEPLTITVNCERMSCTYPNGANNAESLIATPRGEIVIVTKDDNGSYLMKSPTPFQDGASVKMEQLGFFKFFGPTRWSPLATGADLSPDGKHVAVTTYTDIFEWDLPPTGANSTGGWADLWKAAPRITSLPKMKQSESVCYRADSSTLLAGTEGVNAPIWELAAPAAK